MVKSGRGTLLGAVCAFAASAVGQVEPRFCYLDELEMAQLDARGKLRTVSVSPDTGRQSTTTGADAKRVPPWIAARAVDPGSDDLSQNLLLDATILQPFRLDQVIRDDLGFATGIDKRRRALLLTRGNYLQRHEGRHEVSNVVGLVQGQEAYLGQLEMRYGTSSGLLHVVRTQQRAGPLLANGFPCLAIAEMVQTQREGGRDSSKMVRAMLVFPRTVVPRAGANAPDQRARIRVHMVGELQRIHGGALQTRRVHVVSEFTGTGGALQMKLWTSAGESYPFMSWESAFKVKHERGWQTVGAAAVGAAVAWERPYHPLAPVRRGLRQVPVVMLLKLPPRWRNGGYNGAGLEPKKVEVKDARWTLGAGDFVAPGGLWQFDRRGELVVQTPLGSMNATKVQAWFRAAFAAAASDVAEADKLRDCLDVILNWAADMPQPAGAGPGERAPAVRKFLDK
ncbi:MAG: hypothetical protein KDC87_02340 [Planctomycetes bacterium]|nr:hypothetical protein [Planctomycetota bacterium]MCB9889682.1 hypothetical protein [Planctomycetota bacterium]